MFKSLFQKEKYKMPPWHPDFKEISRLPNLQLEIYLSRLQWGSICLAILLFLGCIAQEVYIISLKGKIKDYTEEINAQESINREIVKMDNEFKEKSQFIEEIKTLVYPNLNCITLLMELASSKPENFKFRRFAIQNQFNKTRNTKTPGLEKYYLLTLVGKIKGDYDTSLSQITDYRYLVTNFPSLQRWVENTSITNLQRNDKGSYSQLLYTLQIQLHLNKE